MGEAAVQQQRVRRYGGESGRSLVEDLVQRYGALKTQRALWEFDWQDQVRYLLPGADDILEIRSLGQSRTEYIYDSQPLLAPQSLAANMQGAVTNPAIQWFRLRFRLGALHGMQHVNQWLEVCDHTMLAAYNQSNFYQAAHTYYLNLGTFGTAAMLVQARYSSQGGALTFRTLPTGSYCLAENADGRVDTLYREVWLTPRQAVQLFEGQVSEAVQTAAAKPGEMDTPRCFVHAVLPRVGRDPRKVDNQNMPYASLYFEADTKFLNEESGYQEFPYVVSRWETMSRSPYGFGPGHMALPDVRMLNTLRELNLQQLTLWVQPPLKALQEGIIGNISLESRAVNVVRQMDALMPLDVTGRPDLVQLNQEDLRKSIQDCFFVNALQALPPPDAGTMTAYEVAQRIEQMQRLMGPAFSRLLAEMLDPLADRVFGLLFRARALPPPPLEVLVASQQEQGQLDIEYEGPLARAQRGADQRAIQEVIALGGQISSVQGHLEVLDNIDWDAAYRQAVEIAGAPRGMVRDVVEVLKMRTARAQAHQQMQLAAEQRATLQALGQAAPMVREVRAGQPGEALPAAS